MIICIEFDDKEITMDDAFHIIHIAKASNFRHDVIYGGRRFKVNLAKSPLVDESYTVERA